MLKNILVKRKHKTFNIDQTDTIDNIDRSLAIYTILQSIIIKIKGRRHHNHASCVHPESAHAFHDGRDHDATLIEGADIQGIIYLYKKSLV